MERAGGREFPQKVCRTGRAGMGAPASSSQSRLVTGTGHLVEPPRGSRSTFSLSIQVCCFGAFQRSGALPFRERGEHDGGGGCWAGRLHSRV